MKYFIYFPLFRYFICRILSGCHCYMLLLAFWGNYIVIPVLGVIEILYYQCHCLVVSYCNIWCSPSLYQSVILQPTNTTTTANSFPVFIILTFSRCHSLGVTFFYSYQFLASLITITVTPVTFLFCYLYFCHCSSLLLSQCPVTASTLNKFKTTIRYCYNFIFYNYYQYQWACLYNATTE